MASPTSQNTFSGSVPPNIHESFDLRLPRLRVGKIPETAPAQDTGTLTRNAAPCLVFIDRPVSDYTSIANTARQDARTKCPGSLGLRIAESMDSFLLTTEGDVVAVSMSYLIHPVTVVLNSLYSGLVVQMHEYVPKVADLGNQRTKNDNDDSSDGEDGSGSFNVRFDLCWRIEATGKTIAILEFKRPTLIKYKDFKNSILSSNATEHHVRFMCTKSSGLTKLADLGLRFTKQVTAYSQISHCPFAGLFSWDTMVLFHFHKLKGDDVGEVGKITWIEEGSAPSDRFRKALLGWLIEACGHAGLSSS